jgi:Ca2+-binding RTX toxin-like protein
MKGDDLLLGGGGEDVLFGGPGDDELRGGPVGPGRADELDGGSGRDVFTVVKGEGGKVIPTFERGEPNLQSEGTKLTW